MLDAVQHYTESEKQSMTESQLAVKTLLQLNQDKKRHYTLASPNETDLFASPKLILGENDTIHEHLGPPRILSGTQGNLPWHLRDTLLQICPEYKVVFPSLHDPNCFGASPNAEACAASICALQPNRPKRGC
jgi:hypothetical protein